MTALTDSEEEEESDAEEETDKEQPEDKLCVLLERIDRLHQGTESDKRESLKILLEQREEVRSVNACYIHSTDVYVTGALPLRFDVLLQFGQNSPFLWRLIRAYCDVHDVSSTQEEKKTHAESGNSPNLVLRLICQLPQPGCEVL